jgi:hypothetical protein
VVGGVIGALDAPQALLFGLPDERGRLRVAGRTVPFDVARTPRTWRVLMPPRRAHPGPERIPPSRFGQLPGDLVDYTPTEPLLVVEVHADLSFEHGRWRHPDEVPQGPHRSTADGPDLTSVARCAAASGRVGQRHKPSGGGRRWIARWTVKAAASTLNRVGFRFTADDLLSAKRRSRRRHRHESAPASGSSGF